MGAQSFTYDEGEKTLTANAFTRANYYFAGWNTVAAPTAENPGTTYADEAEVQNLTAEEGGNVTLYAQWIQHDYSITVTGTVKGTVSVNVNGTENAVTARYNDTVTLTVAPNTGYKLDSLLVMQGETPVAVENDTFRMPAGDVTITAIFIPDPVHFSVNDEGTEYTIHSDMGWGLFCDALQDNDSYNRFRGKTVKLAADLGTETPITRMAGSSQHDFMGTFDGNDQTINVLYGSEGDPITANNAAPFCYVETGCVIEKLHVTGDIYTRGQYAAGIAGTQYGTVTIRNCRVSVAIHSSTEGEGRHGGVVGKNGVSDYSMLIIEGVLFDGSLLGDATTHWGGFVGYRGGTLSINNSLFAPAALTAGVAGSATFASNGTSHSHFMNSYYRCTLGDAQGIAAHTVTAGEYVTIDFGWSSLYTVSGITTYDAGLSYDGVFYAGNGDVLELTLAHSEREGYTFLGYEASAGTLYGPGVFYSSDVLRMSDEDVIVTASYRRDLILTQPADVSVPLGKTAKTTVVAEGEGLSYQWYYRDPGKTAFSLSTVTKATYSFTLTTAKIGREVYCVVTDAEGNTETTRTATITVELPEDYVYPAFTQDAADCFVSAGGTASVTVAAEGYGELKYQWYLRNPGAETWSRSSNKTDTYSVAMKLSLHGREVYCVVSDAYGNSVQSETAVLGFDFPEGYTGPAITLEPADCYVDAGGTAEVTVAAEGCGELSYQWYYRNAGAEKFSKSSIKVESYAVAMTLARDGRQLYCVVSDAYGLKAASETVTIGYDYPEGYARPVVTGQSESVAVEPGEQAVATVAAEGTELSYRWYYWNESTEKWTATSVKTDTYSVAMNLSRNGRVVKCVVKDSFGAKAESEPVTLSMNITEGYTGPVILTQPEDAAAPKGQTASTTVEAEGEGLSYQWYFKNAGAEKWSRSSIKTDTYATGMSASKSGRQVYCVVTDRYGYTATSAVATLTMG